VAVFWVEENFLAGLEREGGLLAVILRVVFLGQQTRQWKPIARLDFTVMVKDLLIGRAQLISHSNIIISVMNPMRAMMIPQSSRDLHSSYR
jgi:hypothetical protein